MPQSFLLRPLFLSGLLALAPAHGSPDDDTHWHPGFGLGNLEGVTASIGGAAKALAVDSTHLYIGGSFAKVGGMRVNNIVRYDKRTGGFERLGTPEACGTDGEVLVIKLVPGGVHVGGRFAKVGVDSANQGGLETGPYAAWDGSRWMAVGPKLTSANGSNGLVSAIAFGTTATYVGGAFAKAGDVEVNNIAAFKGPGYEPLYDQGRLANGVSGATVTIAGHKVTDIIVTGTHLFVSGNITVAGGRAVSNVARWNWTSETWDNMLGGRNHAPSMYVQDMDVDHLGRIYAAYRGLAHFEDTGWVAFPGTDSMGISSVIYDTPFGTMVRGGGGSAFDSGSIAFYDGQKWKSPPLSRLGFTQNAEMVFAADDERLWIGGGSIGGANLAAYDGETFSALGNGLRTTRTGGLGFNDFVEFEGDIIAAGSFGGLGGHVMEGVARWTGEAWEPMAGEWSSYWRLAVFKDRLYAAGSFQKSGSPHAGGLARWTGTAWEIVPGFEKSSLEAVSATGNYLYVAGTGLSTAEAGSVGRWDGATLEVFEKELTSTAQIGINAIVPLGGDRGFCVSGHFNKVNGVATGGAACYEGGVWKPMGQALATGSTTHMANIGDDLYLACYCTFPGGAKNIARWDGTEWVAVGGGVTGSGLQRLAANGSDLYVVGSFTKAGDIPANGVARWDGKDWSALGTGVQPATANSVYVGPGGLWMGGSFTTAGGISSRNIANYRNVEKKAAVPMGIARAGRVTAGKARPSMLRVRGGMELNAEGKAHRADGKHLRRIPGAP